MKQRFRIIIIFMAISLFGIIIVQVLWIRHAIKAEEAQFDKSVYGALTAGITQLEKLGKVRELGINPYPNRCKRTHKIGELIEKKNLVREIDSHLSH